MGSGHRGVPLRRPRGWRARPLGALAALCLALGAPQARAQEAAPPDTEAGPDTVLTPADSARLRVMERLGRLARPVGVDSVEIRALEDSLALVDQSGRGGGLGAAPAAASSPGAAGPAIQSGSDTILAALAELEGYAVTQYSGEEAHLDRERRLVLVGAEGDHAVIRRPEGEVRSDTVVYEPSTGRLRTEGGDATLVPSQGDELTSEALIFDTGEQRGTALGATTTYTQGGEWRVRGDLPSVNAETVYGSHTEFTSCQLDEPHYHFRAGEVKIHGGNWLVARPVTLYFGDVPVAWLPFIAQGLGSGRSSGLLTPRFSINDIVRNSSGYNRRISNVGFYWATSDYMDMSLGLDWWDQNYTALTGTFRYNWARQFLNGALNYRQFWRVNGSKELAFDTNHQWAPDERTSVRLSARFSSNNDFVRENTFDPREVTQSIDSNGGLSRRFDWGTMTLGVNRRQFLSDDRIETTLPTANLSLSPMTFFSAPSNRASWYNNLTWSGGGSVNRRTLDVAEVPDSIRVTNSLADQLSTSASARSSFNLGALSWGQTFNFSENVFRDVDLEPEPVDSTAAGALLSGIRYGGRAARGFEDEPLTVDNTKADISWSMSLDYQQRLVGSTTLTPALAISGQSLRSDELARDSVPEAANFVSAPLRISAGAQLKTDVYGFWPGFAGFERVRHKFSPTFSWAYTPSSTPTDLQKTVFNVSDLRARNELRIGLNQTFEAKREPPSEEELAELERERQVQDSLAAVADSLEAAGELPPDSLALDGLGPDSLDTDPFGTDGAGGPRRSEPSRVVKLLAWNTSAVTYDFIRADSLGSFVEGFETPRITNQFSSDFLRGFSISVEHDLFSDRTDSLTLETDRSFDPHLSQLNMGFSIGSRSGIFNFLRGDDEGREEPIGEDEDPFAVRTGTDEASMIPGRPGSATQGRDQRRGSQEGVGGWNASLSYSLTRPREEALSATKNQMLQWTLTFKPTAHWDVSWRSSYDLEAGRFNDHIMRLSRDLHRWEANFDFRQTATGNWTFRFEVSLIDNRDLKFDYKQRDESPFGPTN